MEKRLATEGDDDTVYDVPMGDGIVYDSFDAMNLKKDLLRGIYEYGYKKPSLIQQRGIVPLSEGRDLVMQGMFGPRRTSTYCIGILQQLDIHLHKCQCLIIPFSWSEAKEIAVTMQKLGQFLGVKVYACIEIGDHISTDCHVVVVSFDRVLSYVRKRTLCPEEIKIVVLDEATTFMRKDFRVDMIYEVIDYIAPDDRNRVQIAAFSETMPEKVLKSITNKMKDNPLVILAENKSEELSLDGINKHMFVDVVEEDLKWNALEEIIRTIQETCGIAPTMVFVSNTKLDYLTEELKRSNYKVSVTRTCMDQKERDEITKDFLYTSGLILTTSLWARGIIEECFDKVRYIVIYDNRISVDEYIDRLGWLQGANVAITFATTEDWYNLVSLQEEYEIVVERLQFSQDWTGFGKKETVSFLSRLESIFSKEAPTVKHFIFDVGDEHGKFAALLECEDGCGLYDQFAFAGLIVIFVNFPHQIPLLKSKLVSKYIVFTPEDDDFLYDMSNKYPRVFITSDESDVKVKVKVNLVVHFDVSSKHDSYYRRLDWCKSNGIFLLLTTDVNWCELFDMQTLYGVFARSLPADFVDILKKMGRSTRKLAHVHRRRSRPRGQLKN